MPRKVAVRNWSFAQRRRISKVRESFEEIDLGQSIYDSLVGTDFIDPTVAPYSRSVRKRGAVDGCR